MKQHPSSEEISRLAAHAPPEERERHLRECSECRIEIRHFDETLAAFRESVHAWTEANASAQPAAFAAIQDAIENDRRPARAPAWRWAAAAAAVVAVAAVPAYWLAPGNGPNSGAVENAVVENGLAGSGLAGNGTEDERLLDMVNAQLSRNVPEPMTPLLQLLSAADPAAPAAGGSPTFTENGNNAETGGIEP